MAIVITASVTITVTDSTGANVSAVINLNVDGTGLKIDTTSLPDGTVGEAYNESIAVEGGSPPYSYAADGLPAGLTIDPVFGVISGTPSGVII